jgi:hypothetical protein
MLTADQCSSPLSLARLIQAKLRSEEKQGEGKTFFLRTLEAGTHWVVGILRMTTSEGEQPHAQAVLTVYDSMRPPEPGQTSLRAACRETIENDIGAQFVKVNWHHLSTQFEGGVVVTTRCSFALH